MCKKKGHLANMCKQKNATVATGGEGGSAKPAGSALKLLSFAVGPKKGAAREGGEIGVLEEVFSAGATPTENFE